MVVVHGYGQEDHQQINEMNSRPQEVRCVDCGEESSRTFSSAHSLTCHYLVFHPGEDFSGKHGIPWHWDSPSANISREANQGPPDVSLLRILSFLGNQERHAYGAPTSRFASDIRRPGRQTTQRSHARARSAGSGHSNKSKASQRSWGETNEFDFVLKEIVGQIDKSHAQCSPSKFSKGRLSKKGRSKRELQHTLEEALRYFSTRISARANFDICLAIGADHDENHFSLRGKPPFVLKSCFHAVRTEGV